VWAQAATTLSLAVVVALVSLVTGRRAPPGTIFLANVASCYGDLWRIPRLDVDDVKTLDQHPQIRRLVVAPDQEEDIAKLPQSFRDRVQVVYMHKVDELEALFLEEEEEEGGGAVQMEEGL
jgi:hypothetical protein